MRRAMDDMERGMERDGRPMERGRMERGGPRSRHDMSPGWQPELESDGTVVLVSNMNKEVLNTTLLLCPSYCSVPLLPTSSLSLHFA